MVAWDVGRATRYGGGGYVAREQMLVWCANGIVVGHASLLVSRPGLKLRLVGVTSYDFAKGCSTQTNSRQKCSHGILPDFVTHFNFGKQ